MQFPCIPSPGNSDDQTRVWVNDDYAKVWGWRESREGTLRTRDMDLHRLSSEKYLLSCLQEPTVEGMVIFCGLFLVSTNLVSCAWRVGCISGPT